MAAKERSHATIARHFISLCAVTRERALQPPARLNPDLRGLELVCAGR